MGTRMQLLMRMAMMVVALSSVMASLAAHDWSHMGTHQVPLGDLLGLYFSHSGDCPQHLLPRSAPSSPRPSRPRRASRQPLSSSAASMGTCSSSDSDGDGHHAPHHPPTLRYITADQLPEQLMVMRAGREYRRRPLPGTLVLRLDSDARIVEAFVA